MRTTLWNQWRRMELAWCNHNPVEGNVGLEALAELGKIVEGPLMAYYELQGVSSKQGKGRSAPSQSHHFPRTRLGTNHRNMSYETLGRLRRCRRELWRLQLQPGQEPATIRQALPWKRHEEPAARPRW